MVLQRRAGEGDVGVDVAANGDRERIRGRAVERHRVGAASTFGDGERHRREHNLRQVQLGYRDRLCRPDLGCAVGGRDYNGLQFIAYRVLPGFDGGCDHVVPGRQRQRVGQGELGPAAIAEDVVTTNRGRAAYRKRDRLGGLEEDPVFSRINRQCRGRISFHDLGRLDAQPPVQHVVITDRHREDLADFAGGAGMARGDDQGLIRLDIQVAEGLDRQNETGFSRPHRELAFYCDHNPIIIFVLERRSIGLWQAKRVKPA